MSSAVEAVYLFNQDNECILEHVYRSRPPTPRTLLPLYQRHPKPRPSVINLPDVNPPTVLFSLVHSNLLFLSTASTDVEPLFILEFLHRIIDVFEEFIGGPLLASRIESSYDVVAQLLGEMCDAGSVCNTEPNALRDDVDIPGWMDKFLGGVGLPGSPGSLPSGGLKHQLKLAPIPNGPAIPWRRANVRHTSNELYVDILETLRVTLAPSGRPLAAIANGSIACTSKISGVPDLLLTLSASGGKLGLEKAIELPVFHPCVRLARWKERPGELSFVPPDGKFMLAGYEVNLMPSIHDLKSWSNVNLQLPVSIEVSKSLGPAGADFEVRLAIYNTFPGVASAASAPRPALGSRGSGISTPVFGGRTSTSPTLQDLVVTIPIPNAVRSVIDLRASRGEAYFTASESVVEWRISTKAAASPGTATLRCTVVGPLAETDAEDMANGFHSDPGAGDYDEHRDAYQSSSDEPAKKPSTREQHDSQDTRRVQQNSSLMPASASVSFSVKGWLASGIKVDGLNIDTHKSRGLGEGVKPYKGVKYLTAYEIIAFLSNPTIMADTLHNAPIVLDNGSGTIRAGFAGEDLPKCYFPSYVGRPKHVRVLAGALEGDVFIGRRAQELRGLLKVRYPLEHGIVTDWEDMERIWQFVYTEELKTLSEEHPVLLTEPPLNPRSNRDTAAQLLFETFNVPAIYTSIQAVLSLYASGRTTGVVLDAGDGVSHAVPVYEGFAMPNSIRRIDVAGRDVTEHMQLLFRKSGLVLHTSAEKEIVREIKEKTCYVAPDPKKEEREWIQHNGRPEGKLAEHTLPDGKKIKIGSERWKAPEILFEPELIGLEYPGIHQIVVDAINRTDMDLRKSLFGNIVLSGGSTLCKGFGDRLLHEVQRLAVKDMRIKIFAPPERKYSTWIGGSILAGLSTFRKMWVSIDEWHEDPDIIHKKFA
ncbi:MAG: hypothetical protein LQ341_004620 [Variospora aurantia]|nr:MAG: hypothetical protein LQ341_004620 [Variospora aurantia]